MYWPERKINGIQELFMYYNNNMLYIVGLKSWTRLQFL